MTKDIGKLLLPAYAKRLLNEWGVPPIKEWHFVIPEQNDSRIVKHAETKKKEVMDAKRANPVAFQHIHDDFKVILKCADDFLLEISQLIRTNLTDMKLNLTVIHSASPDWSRCNSEKTANIRRKVAAVMQTADTESINRMVTLFVESYISGLDILARLQLSAPDFHRDLIELEAVCKRDVEMKTLMNTNPADNSSLFWKIMTDFEEKLNKDFSGPLTQSSIGELKQDLIASWLADCSMEFRG